MCLLIKLLRGQTSLYFAESLRIKSLKLIPRLHGSVLAEAQRLYEEALSMEMDAVLRFDEYYSGHQCCREWMS